MQKEFADASCLLEREPLHWLAGDGQLIACRHDGFLYAMDSAMSSNPSTSSEIAVALRVKCGSDRATQVAPSA